MPLVVDQHQVGHRWDGKTWAHSPDYGRPIPPGSHEESVPFGSVWGLTYVCPQGNIKKNNIPSSEAGEAEGDTVQRPHKVVCLGHASNWEPFVDDSVANRVTRHRSLEVLSLVTV